MRNEQVRKQLNTSVAHDLSIHICMFDPNMKYPCALKPETYEATYGLTVFMKNH